VVSANPELRETNIEQYRRLLSRIDRVNEYKPELVKAQRESNAIRDATSNINVHA